MPSISSEPVPLWEQLHHGHITWIQVDRYMPDGVDEADPSGSTLVTCYETRWSRRKVIRRKLPGWVKKRMSQRHVSLHLEIYQGTALHGKILCKVRVYDSDMRVGRIHLPRYLGHQTNSITEMMDWVASQYPGTMLGLPWADSYLIQIKKLTKPAMWGFWLALLALAWNIINEWFR